jgi:mevalonate kinase
LEFYSHGKLLITGEYFVLDGARALALPTRQGQFLRVERSEAADNILEWSSYTREGARWFFGHFALPSGEFLEGSDLEVGRRLEQILRCARELRSEFWDDQLPASFRVSTQLEFPRNWGLGTSSTLISNLARWWQVDAYALLAASFGGSGYDLACASASGPIYYQLKHKQPTVASAPFYPPFADQLYFIFLEQKQNSREGIAHYRAQQPHDARIIDRISELSELVASAADLNTFRQLLEEHEVLVSESIAIAPVKERLFPDFPGTVKSLGAWGGDFVLVASDRPSREIRQYFKPRGYHTLIPYRKMVI